MAMIKIYVNSSKSNGKNKNMKILSSILLICSLLNQISYSICLDNAIQISKTTEDDSESTVIDENESMDETEDIFIPSTEWKEVKKNQKVPAGLHIRMNLETGLKEAKLLDDEQNTNKLESSKSLVHVKQEEEVKTTEENTDQLKKIESRMRDNIVDALKNIKSEDKKSPKELIEESNQRKHLYRSYEELKADFQELNMNIETDSEMIKKLISEFSEVGNDEMKINILEDLDYLAHQVDNAENFVSLGGIIKLILPGLNSTNENVRKGVMKLLGSASQSNPKVQIAVLEAGLLSQLLRVVAREKDATISSRAVFAVSCLVRGFPFGQQRLVESGGLFTLREVFHKQDWQSLSLQLKVVSLMHDLLQERLEAKGERANQLNRIDLLGSLIDGDWCSAISSLLTAASFDKRGMRQDMGAALGKEVPLRPDHDMVDKVVGTMAILAGRCRSEFSTNLPILKSLENTYDDLAYKERFQGQDGHEFFQQVANQIRYLVGKVAFNKEEL